MNAELSAVVEYSDKLNDVRGEVAEACGWGCRAQEALSTLSESCCNGPRSCSESPSISTKP